MRVRIKFNNGTPEVDYKAPQPRGNEKAFPVELMVEQVGSRSSILESVDSYISTIDYVFGGVSNHVTGHIEEMTLQKQWFGTITKKGSEVDWRAMTDKSHVVVYDISAEGITENMYIADGIAVPRAGSPATAKVEPLWLEDLMSPLKSSKARVNQAIQAISITTRFLTEYKMVWGYQGVQGITVTDKHNRPVLIDDIAHDESYLVIKFLSLLMGKGMHLGVMTVNCRGLSDKTIEAFVEASNLFFRDTFVFLYNMPSGSRVERETLTLPNFLSNYQ